MRMTAIISSLNQRQCLELTVRTLHAVAHQFLDKILIIDSSDRRDVIHFVDEIGKEMPSVETYRISGPRHGDKVHYGVQKVSSELIVLVDSDVEFFNNAVFHQALSKFSANPNLFMLAERYEPYMRHGFLVVERPAPHVLFMKTNVMKQYVAKGTPTEGPRRDGKTWPCMSYIYEESIKDGHGFDPDIDTTSYHHWKGLSYRDAVDENKEIAIRLEKKVWLGLKCS